MKIKSIFFILIILTFGIVLTGCTLDGSMPGVIPLEESVKEIINSKGENYDFLEDELYNIKIEELIETILDKLDTYNINYKVGNLDEDSVPEIAVFVERNPEDTEDQGLLQIYKFNGESYVVLDEIGMNYDNNNYGLEIGLLSTNQPGLIINNQVGAHSGITYGYILEEGKLKSILNHNKINLLSVYTDNQIKDIDGDGILDFSVYTIDPETIELSSAGSDKITLWYKWDGNDSTILTKVEREIPDLESNKQIFRTINSTISVNDLEALKTLIENQNQLSYLDNTVLLKKYIQQLELTLNSRNEDINNLFSDYQSGYLLSEYGLSIDRLNDIEYLKAEKTLANEKGLKNALIANLELGYKLKTSEGKYYYTIDYSRLTEPISSSISKEYRDYLTILGSSPVESHITGESFLLNQEKLGIKINTLEKFLITYPYSEYIEEVQEMYNAYTHYFIYGNETSPNWDPEQNKAEDDVIDTWNMYIEKYPYSSLSESLNKLIQEIKNDEKQVTYRGIGNLNLKQKKVKKPNS